MSKHTPEPWIVCEHDAGCRDATNFGLSIEQDRERCGEEPSIIAEVDIDGDGIDLETGRANAARIVACVNACAGMDDPAAEISRLRARLAAWKAEAEAWRQADDCDPMVRGECIREARERRAATDAIEKNAS